MKTRLKYRDTYSYSEVEENFSKVGSLSVISNIFVTDEVDIGYKTTYKLGMPDLYPNIRMDIRDAVEDAIDEVIPKNVTVPVASWTHNAELPFWTHNISFELAYTCLKEAESSRTFMVGELSRIMQEAVVKSKDNFEYKLRLDLYKLTD